MSLLVETRHKQGDFLLEASFRSEGGVTALFGRSGSGKTSIIRIIAGLTSPDFGRVFLDGQVLADTENGISVPCHKRRFGYVFQEARLFPHLSVRQNLSYGRWFSPARGHNAGEFDRIVSMLGIDTMLDRRPGKLSGGEKQRVAVGRALLSQPKMLLMDEPLAALDEARKQEILPYLERLRDEMNIPIIYVSHSVPEVARLADRVIVMRDGKVEATGPASDILGQAASIASLDRRDTGSIVSGIVEGSDPAHHLVTVRLSAGNIHIPQASANTGSKVRIHIAARDVMLATKRPEGLSALNILEGKIDTIVPDIDGMVTIRVDCSGDALLARITEYSRQALALVPGMPIFAVIKTVALEAG